MSTRRDPAPRLLEFARDMRHAPTEAEQKLWSYLRDRRLGGFKFRRQHPVGRYILDFFCEAASTTVELDGSQHTNPPRHRLRPKTHRRLGELAHPRPTFLRSLNAQGPHRGRSYDPAHPHDWRIEDPHPNPLPAAAESFPQICHPSRPGEGTRTVMTRAPFPPLLQAPKCAIL
jgi:hypothetical protein